MCVWRGTAPGRFSVLTFHPVLVPFQPEVELPSSVHNHHSPSTHHRHTILHHSPRFRRRELPEPARSSAPNRAIIARPCRPRFHRIPFRSRGSRAADQHTPPRPGEGDVDDLVGSPAPVDAALMVLPTTPALVSVRPDFDHTSHGPDRQQEQRAGAEDFDEELGPHLHQRRR